MMRHSWLVSSLILAMAIVGRAKYAHARARKISRRRDAKGAPKKCLEISRARACVYFARPTIAIAKIRDYSQSTLTQSCDKKMYCGQATGNVRRTLK